MLPFVANHKWLKQFTNLNIAYSTQKRNVLLQIQNLDLLIFQITIYEPYILWQNQNDELQ